MFGNKAELQFGQHLQQNQEYQDPHNFNDMSSLSAGIGPRELESIHTFVFSQLKPDEKNKFFEVMVNSKCEFTFDSNDGGYTATIRPQPVVNTIQDQNANFPNSARVRGNNSLAAE